MAKKPQLQKTKDLMAAMLGMKPKQHEDMKLGKKRKKAKKPARKQRD